MIDNNNNNNNLQQKTAFQFVCDFQHFIELDKKLCCSYFDNFDSNANKRIKTYKTVIHKLKAIPADVVLEAELTKNGRYNVGTLCECIVKAMLDGCKQKQYTKAVHGADVVIGKKHYEIKTSLNKYCIATPCKADARGKYNATILVNAEGAWLINANDVAGWLNNKGVLGCDIKPGKLYKKLNDLWMALED